MPLKAIWANNNSYSRFLLAVGVVLICAVLFTLIGMLVVSAYYGISPAQLQDAFNSESNPQAISMLKFMQTISAIGAFVVPAFVIAFLFDQKPLNYLSLSKKVSVTSIILVSLAIILALPFINYLGELNSRMSLPSFLSGLENWMKESEKRAAELTGQFLVMNSMSDMLFNVFMIGLLPALGEELLFRGIIQRLFVDWSKSIHVGIWTSAILFSAMHMQFYGFIPRMLLGALFGYMLVWSGSLWLPVCAHFINNSLAVITTYLYKEQLTSLDSDKIGTEGEYFVVIACSFVAALLLWTVFKIEKSKKENPALA